MLGRRMSGAMIEELQCELKDLSDQGAGIGELLDELRRRTKPHFGRRNSLTKVQFDELSRYCWALQHAKSNVLWGRARDLWGDRTTLRTRRLGSGSGRRASRAG